MRRITIIGLGPAGLDQMDPRARSVVDDPARLVVLRTLQHPAAAELAGLRPTASCDDLYAAAARVEDVYGAIADRVLAAAGEDVVYAVPGSPLVGERAVALIRDRAAEAGVPVDLVAGASFLDLVLDRVGLDPLERGVQVVDARQLPDPLILHLPTIVAQVDRPVVLAGVHTTLGRTLSPDLPVTVLSDLGGPAERVAVVPLAELVRVEVGPRTTLFLDPPPSGWHGLVVTNRRLRAECPWDARQTHHSLVNHLVEESYELVEALSELPTAAPGGDTDFGAYAEVEEELGDVLLQVVFHATLAREAGVFDVEEVAEGIRRKLVERHPHVFDGAEVSGASEVIRTWERRKQTEKGRASLMDGVASSLPALARARKFQQRAASVGFDWPDAGSVLDKVVEEVGELRLDLDDPGRAGDELGDLLFSVVNLARHLHVDPELALRRAADRFERRFRVLERLAGERGVDAGDLDAAGLDDLWEAAKDELG